MSDSIILDASADTSIVFGGVAWRPLVGSNLAAQSLKEAQSNKATHYLPAGSGSVAVGTTKLPPKRAKEKGRSFYSAGAIFSQAHLSGVCITSQDMADGRVWVVACHDGIILRETDVLLPPQEAAALVQEILTTHKQALVVEGDFEAALHVNARTKLVPVKSGLQKIPTPLLVFAGVVITLIVCDTGWDQYKKFKTRKALELEAQQFVDARAEWGMALDEWAQNIKIDGRVGLVNLFSEAGKAPMKIGGWELAKVRCSSAPGEWRCSANYDAGINATNLSFKNNLPLGWSALWDGLTGAVGEWTVKVDRQSIERARIMSIQDFSLNSVSQLQRVLPAFKTVDLKAPAPVSIQTPMVPVKTGRGQEMVPVPYPAENPNGIEIPSVQQIEVVGPLRSLYVLPLINETVIRDISFIVEGRTSLPSLRDSLFTATLTGEIYVR